MDRNAYDFETRYGIKSIELIKGDIFSIKETIDLLVISAYIGSYKNIKGTLIADLISKGVNFNEILQNAEIDLRTKQNIWLSEKIKNKNINYNRLAGIEFKRTDSSYVLTKTMLEDRFNSFFGMLLYLEYKNIYIETIAMPVLGSNQQRLNAKDIIEIMLAQCSKAMKRLKSVKKIYFVEKSDFKFSILSNEFDMFLGRTDLDIAKIIKDKVIYSEIDTIIKTLDDICENMDNDKRVEDICKEISIFKNVESNNGSILCISCRRIAEYMVNDIIDILGDDSGILKSSLYNKIKYVSEKLRMSLWMKSYMDIIRIIGNTSAHDKNIKGYLPLHPNENDLNILICCLANIVMYWKNERYRYMNKT